MKVLLVCTKTSAIEYNNDKVLFKIELWELALQKCDEIQVPSNPPDIKENNISNINAEETKEDGLAGKKGSSGIKCCLKKNEKLAVPAKDVLLESTNIWVDGSGASAHCTNDRCRGSNKHKGSGAGTMGAYGEAMAASSFMDIARAWCNKFD